MKRVSHRANVNKPTAAMTKATQTAKTKLLQKLNEAADAARTRVSGYSDERRNQLEQLARGTIQGAKTKQICSR